LIERARGSSSHRRNATLVDGIVSEEIAMTGREPHRLPGQTGQPEHKEEREPPFRHLPERPNDGEDPREAPFRFDTEEE